MEYMPCPSDPDLWMNSMVRPSDGAEYHAYTLLSVDGILFIYHNAEIVLTKVDKCSKLKPDSIREPDIY